MPSLRKHRLERRRVLPHFNARCEVGLHGGSKGTGDPEGPETHPVKGKEQNPEISSEGPTGGPKPPRPDGAPVSVGCGSTGVGEGNRGDWEDYLFDDCSDYEADYLGSLGEPCPPP